jgi:hypothetical protein
MQFKQVIVLLLVLSILILRSPSPAIAAEHLWDQVTESYTKPLNITVYSSPSCGCCGDWIQHLNTHGFRVKSIKTDEVEVIKQQHNIPEALTSCHTGLIDGYWIEGHVPADDIKRALKAKLDLAGLTVPQMPVGTPGMEMGEQHDPFQVLGLKNNGDIQVVMDYQFSTHDNS